MQVRNISIRRKKCDYAMLYFAFLIGVLAFETNLSRINDIYLAESVKLVVT
jgi:hypothetical protein